MIIVFLTIMMVFANTPSTQKVKPKKKIDSSHQIVGHFDGDTNSVALAEIMASLKPENQIAKKVAPAVGAIINGDFLRPTESGKAVTLESQSLEEAIKYIHSPDKKHLLNLCSPPKYKDRRTASGLKCASFLYKQNIIFSAGHCLTSCENYKVVFGYTRQNKEIPNDKIYGCKKVLKQKFKEGLEYALIELDRDVKGIKPLEVNKDPSSLEYSIPLFKLGYPHGLPLTYSKGIAQAYIPDEKNKDPIQSSTSLSIDTGDSGGPVINPQTGLVEGIISTTPVSYKVNKQKNCIQATSYNSDTFKFDQLVKSHPTHKELENYWLSGSVIIPMSAILKDLEAPEEHTPETSPIQQ